MSEKYLRHQSLPIDNDARERVKRLINEYASRSEGHPFGDYGNEIVLQKYDLDPIYVEHLHSQYDTRPVNNKQYPYRGGDVYNRRFYKPSDVDVWSYNLLTTDKFVHNGKSFEVPGSHHVETCTRCSGSGRVICSNCGGDGRNTCSSCGGSGQIQKSESRYEVTGYNVYSDGHREPVYGYRTHYYYVNCGNCGGSGTVQCRTCGGSGKVTCPVCEGNGKNVHCFTIDQSLENVRDSHYFFTNNMAKIEEIVDQKKQLSGQHLFHERQTAISKGVFTEDSQIGAQLDSDIGQHAGKTGSNCHILFQEADIYRVDAWWVQYTYKGRPYTGCITSALGEERFYAGVSPITELADKWLKEAKKKVGGVGTIKARKLLEQVEKLHVYGRTGVQAGIESKVNTHLNTLYNMGNDLMFWLVALLGTPFIYNFYHELNPVLRYAHIVNDPAWRPSSCLPILQCLIFLGLLWFIKSIMNNSDHSKARHLTVFGYVFTGMGLYLLIAAGILAAMLGLNYLGLSVLTSGVFWLGLQVLKIAFIALVYAIMLGFMLLKWIWGLLVKLWHFIF